MRGAKQEKMQNEGILKIESRLWRDKVIILSPYFMYQNTVKLLTAEF